MSFVSPYCQLTPGCENPRMTNMEGCYSCQHEKRRAEKEALKPKKVYSLPKPTKRIAPRSEKRVEEDKEYKVLHAEHLAEFPNCQIRIMDICVTTATTVHHSGKRGANYLNKDLFMSACMPCHDFVETRMSAAERREKGFLK